MYCDVVVSNNSLFVENTYTYKIPNGIDVRDIVGKRVTIPFGNDTKLGLIISICENSKTEFLAFKEIICLVDDYPIVTKDIISVLQENAKRTGNTISRYLNSIYPITFNLQRKTVYQVLDIDRIDLVLRSILPSNEFEIVGELVQYERDINKYLKHGYIVSKDLYTRKADYKYSEYVMCTGLKPLRINANQEEIIEIINNSKNGKVKIKTLVNEFGFSKNTINTMIKKSILEKKSFREKPEINSSAESLKIDHVNDKRKILVHSNIPSNRINYIKQIIKEKMNSKENVLILLPDVASIPFITSEIENNFSEKIGVYHSKISDRKKFDLLTEMNNDEINVLIGVGGAALAPLKNIGAIIMYDSSDQRYLKSQYNFYDISTITEMRAEICTADLIHISASPSISEYYKKQNDKVWEYVRLENKFKFQKSMVDMKGELKKGNHQILSLELQEKLRRRVSNFETSFLLVNVTNDNSSIKCRGCGKTTLCPHCGTNLKLSDKTGKLLCTSCRFEMQFENKCIYCGSDKIRKMKLGIENVFEFVKKQFKDSSILMLTMEDLTSISKINKIISNINSNKYDIIIGTKNITSILPKNKISLVALVMIDITLNINTYKASELTFNEISAAIDIISNESSNELLIQTYEPDNKILNYAIDLEYDKYYKDEIIYREISKNPPYREIVYLNIRVSENNSNSILNNLNLYMKNNFDDNTYFGPNIIKKNASNMINIIYTIKVLDISEVIRFREILITAFNNESLFITIEHE